MKNDHQLLLDIFDEEKWQILQNSLAQITGMAIITVDYKGVPITTHSGRQNFCGLVRQNGELSRHCEKCDSRGGLEASRLNKPYIYLCHYNIVDAAIPILVNGKYMGAIMAGEVFLSPEEMQQLEPICIFSSKKKLEKEAKQYNQYYNEIPLMSLERINMSVNMIFHLCNYIVSEAIEKNLAYSMRESNVFLNNLALGIGDLSEHPIRTLESIKDNINRIITDTHIQKTVIAKNNKASNKILQPAFQYISEHKNESHSLNKMAALCHISPSYFSRLFAKETGENFSIYVLRSKIDWAKQLLELTGKSVSEIGMDVGFSDSAHFIKTFKKYEGITPSKYRAFCRESI